MYIEIKVSAANVCGEFIKADEPFLIKSNEFGDKSVDAIAQEIGKKMWSEIYREKADQVYYHIHTA